MKTVLLLCGGKSDEHEISLISTKGILNALDPAKYKALVVGITRQGQWHLCDPNQYYEGDFRADKIKLSTKGPLITLAPYLKKDRGVLVANGTEHLFDVVFPVLHGTFGEDGTMQGLLDIVGIPYVGPGCGSSWICMDKVMMKSLARQFDVRVADFVIVRSVDDVKTKKREIEQLGLPVFVKPSRMGSSVGVSKVTDLGDLVRAVQCALKVDRVCLVEKGIQGREIECAVLGLNSSPRVARPGEIIPNPKIGWYSYEAKYLLKDGAETKVPTDLDPKTEKKLQDFAARVFQVFECDGMARVDLFLTPSGEIYLNEPNTIPGFTPISMYPKMWEASGLSYKGLVNELIDLAFKRFS